MTYAIFVRTQNNWVLAHTAHSQAELAEYLAGEPRLVRVKSYRR